MNIVALILAAGALTQLGWQRRELARIQREVVELHETMMRLHPRE